MRLWWLWGIVIVALAFSIIAEKVWPSMAEVNQFFELSYIKEMNPANKEDLMAMLILKPFHYLTSGILLIFTLLLLSYLLKKIIYECRVAYMFRKIPYEPLFLLLAGVCVFIKVILFLPYFTISLTLLILLYEGSIRLPRRKKEVVYVREG